MILELHLKKLIEKSPFNFFSYYSECSVMTQYNAFYALSFVSEFFFIDTISREFTRKIKIPQDVSNARLQKKNQDLICFYIKIGIEFGNVGNF